MNSTSTKFELAGEDLVLLPERAIYWPARGALLLADLHIGKTNHFRKNGMAVPGMAGKNNLWRLSALFEQWAPEEVLFLGDLFHSTANEAWPEFVDFLEAYPRLKRTLVKGNHDILGASRFAEAGLRMVDELVAGPFLLTHDYTPHQALFNLFGHVHPGVKMRGQGRQMLRLPCYFFDTDKRYGILPSFGDFTGMHMLRPGPDQYVFVTTETAVLSVGKTS